MASRPSRSVRIYKDTSQRLKNIAARRDVPMITLIEDAVARALPRLEKEAETSRLKADSRPTRTRPVD
jgi:hypothetical protein